MNAATDFETCGAEDRVPGGWYECHNERVVAQTVNRMHRPLCGRHAQVLDDRAVRYAAELVRLRAELEELDVDAADVDDDHRQMLDEIDQVEYQIADLRCR